MVDTAEAQNEVLLEDLRADATHVAVSTLTIVEHFDVIEDIGTSQLACFVDTLFDAFFL